VNSRFIEKWQPDYRGTERFKVTAGRIEAAANLKPRKVAKKPPTKKPEREWSEHKISYNHSILRRRLPLQP
jgi:hypothetical protein